MKVAFLGQTLLHDGKQFLQASAQPRVLFALQLVQHVPDVARHKIRSHTLQIAAREEGRRLSKIRPSGRQRDSRLATQVCGRVRRHDRVDGEPQIGTDAWNARLDPGRLQKVDEPAILHRRPHRIGKVEPPRHRAGGRSQDPSSADLVALGAVADSAAPFQRRKHLLRVVAFVVRARLGPAEVIGVNRKAWLEHRSGRSSRQSMLPGEQNARLQRRPLIKQQQSDARPVFVERVPLGLLFPLPRLSDGIEEAPPADAVLGNPQARAPNVLRRDLSHAVFVGCPRET
eukprot:5312204-Prymnesium_polylepis.1